MATRKVRIVCVSDTHNHAPGEGYTLPQGSILIHAGDLTNQGRPTELTKSARWITEANFAAKLVVAGNHDLSLDGKLDLERARLHSGMGVTDRALECKEMFTQNAEFSYLEHAPKTIDLPHVGVSLRVFGSPCSPRRSPADRWAFQYNDDEAEQLWESIPDQTNVLITHTPAAGLLDTSAHWQQGGCAALRKRIWRLRPLLHICGHCHEGRGAQIVRWGEDAGGIESIRAWKDGGEGPKNKKQSLVDLTCGRGGMSLEAGRETAVMNASIMAKSYGQGAKTFNKPIVVDVEMPSVDLWVDGTTADAGVDDSPCCAGC